MQQISFKIPSKILQLQYFFYIKSSNIKLSTAKSIINDIINNNN